VDVSGETFPALAGADSITVDPLSNTIYVAASAVRVARSWRRSTGNTNVCRQSRPVPKRPMATRWPSTWARTSWRLAALTTRICFSRRRSDIGVCGADIRYDAGRQRRLDHCDGAAVRTRNTQPKLPSVPPATSRPGASITPTTVFYQVDSWQGTWTTKSSNRSRAPHGHGHRDHAEARCGASHSLRLCQYGEAATIQNGASGPVHSSLVRPLPLSSPSNSDAARDCDGRSMGTTRNSAGALTYRLCHVAPRRRSFKNRVPLATKREQRGSDRVRVPGEKPV